MNNKLNPFKDYHHWHWRTGRKVRRTIYAMHDPDGKTARDEDVLIGLMDTSECAAEAVRQHNTDLDIRSSR